MRRGAPVVIECFARFRDGVSVAAAMAQRSAGAAMAKIVRKRRVHSVLLEPRAGAASQPARHRGTSGEIYGSDGVCGAFTEYLRIRDIVASARAGHAPRAAGKAPVGSATSCSAPPKARRRTERRSYATDKCACTSGATEAASHGKHPTPGQGAAAARHRRETKRWRTTSTDRCASART